MNNVELIVENKNLLGVAYEVGFEIGSRLQQARLSQGKTPKQIAARIKIREIYILAIEAGEWDNLPPGLNGRGLIRVYAKEFGVALPEFEQFNAVSTHVEKFSEHAITTHKRNPSLGGNQRSEQNLTPSSSHHKTTSMVSASPVQNKHTNRPLAQEEIITPSLSDVLGIPVEEDSIQHSKESTFSSIKTANAAMQLHTTHHVPQDEALEVNKGSIKQSLAESSVSFAQPTTIPTGNTAEKPPTKEITPFHDRPFKLDQKKTDQPEHWLVYLKKFWKKHPYTIFSALVFIFVSGGVVCLKIYEKIETEEIHSSLTNPSSSREIDFNLPVANHSQPSQSSPPLSNGPSEPITPIQQKEAVQPLPAATGEQIIAPSITEISPETGDGKKETTASSPPKEPQNVVSLAEDTRKSNQEQRQPLASKGKLASLFILDEVELRVVADGQTVFSGIHKISKLDLAFQNRAEIYIGDGSKVKLIYDGWDQGLQGHAGRRRKIVLNAADYP